MTLLAFLSLDCAGGVGSQDSQASDGGAPGSSEVASGDRSDASRGGASPGSSSGAPTAGDDAGAADDGSLAVVGEDDGATLGADALTSSGDSAMGLRRRGQMGGGAVDAGAPHDAAPADASLSIGDGPSGHDASADAGMASEGGGQLMAVYVTFYGWADNSPPGGSIAYPKIHSAAGGTGTYADPITFATDAAEFAPGTILYVPFIEKYVIMEDDCADADSEWSASHKRHIDLWMNSSAAESTPPLLACEDQWTRSSANVEVNPPPDRLVTTPALFDPSTNVCRSSP